MKPLARPSHVEPLPHHPQNARAFAALPVTEVLTQVQQLFASYAPVEEAAEEAAEAAEEAAEAAAEAAEVVWQAAASAQAAIPSCAPPSSLQHRAGCPHLLQQLAASLVRRLVLPAATRPGRA